MATVIPRPLTVEQIMAGDGKLPTPEPSLEDRLAQAEADVKALAEAMEKLLGVVQQLKAAQAETLAVMRQLLSRT